MQCDKIRDHFSDYLIERLTPNDQAALSRHLQDCTSCKAELEEWTYIWVKMGSLTPAGIGEPASPEMSARLRRAVGGYKKEWSLQAQAARRSGNVWRYALVGVAAVLIVLVSVALFQRFSVTAAPGTVVDGSLNRTWGGQTDKLKIGDTVERGEGLRTDAAGAVLALADGSRVEMRAQTELTLERADDGTRIRLGKGGVIVNAARQHTGHLYVQTKDVTVSVVGTVFLVNAEEEGSRVAVIEGEVRVQQGATSKRLLPGEQVTTSPLIESWPVKDEISWSRNAETHVALLQQSAPQKAADARDTFEEASIRPNDSASGAPLGGPRCPPFQIQINPGRFIAINMSLYNLIALAYGKNCPAPEVLNGGPDWIRADHFDIQALLPDNTPSYTPRQFREGEAPKLQRMLQTLLADRFKVVVHRETKEMSVYNLSVVKEGKLKLSGSQADRVSQPIRSGVKGFNSPEISLSSFVGILQGMVGRPVVDKANLKGLFEIRLEFPVDATPAALNPDGGPAGPDIPSLLAALQDQLGLKLDSSKGPVEVLVIARAEKPTEN